jgi:hypothetical protein
MAFSWRLDPDATPVIIGRNLVRVTIEELEDGVRQTPKVTYFGDIHKDRGVDIPEWKTALNVIFKARKEEILTARAQRTRLALLVANISDSDFDTFEAFLNS